MWRSRKRLTVLRSSPVCVQESRCTIFESKLVVERSLFGCQARTQVEVLFQFLWTVCPVAYRQVNGLSSPSLTPTIGAEAGLLKLGGRFERSMR